MTSIFAIPTRYAGVEFRSRQEARWAMILDRLGVAWEYEPEGFLLAGEGYLPDLYLPDWRVFAEVKGSVDQFTAKARRKAEGLTAGTGRPVLILAEIEPSEQEIPCIVPDAQIGPVTWCCPLGRSALKGQLWLEESRPGVFEYAIGADEFYAAADEARSFKFDRCAA